MSKSQDDHIGQTAADPLGATQAASSGSGSRQAQLFADGTVIAERYRIVSILGRGGMGEVYRAEDKLLGVEVALKTIRSQQPGGEAAAARFRREIQLARKVTHPNVCRIFDVGIHGDIVFLTMELLEGETVAARVKRTGRLPLPEVRAIVEQIAAALSAAHAQGVIHRDLTSHNVILTREGRAVVTDFGLARTANESDATVTSDGEMIGSPAYMSPEQVEGAKSFSPATDIYALGIVMFEMVTGRLPFVGETSMATAVMRIREAAPSPRQFVTDLPPAWEAVIAHCLERSPTARYPSARAVVEALAATAPRRPRWPIAVGAGLLVALLAGTLAFVASRPKKPPVDGAVKTAAQARPSVAIFGFANLTGRKEEEFLALAISEMLSTEMSAGERVRTVPAESVDRARKSLELPAATSFSAETLGRIRNLISSDFVVVGSYVVMTDGSRIHVDAKLQDTRSGETVASVGEDGSRDDLPGLVTAVGARLRKRLGVDELSASETAETRSFLPSSSAAASAYAEGVAALRVHNCGGARAPLERSVSLDPKFALARAQLAWTLYCLGYDKLAVEEGKRAVELAASMPEEARLFTEARLAEAGDKEKDAESIYQRLFDKFPDNFDYGMRLAELQGNKGSPRARPTLDRLRALPSPDRDNARIDVLEALLKVPDLDATVAGLERARAKAEAQGARLVAAEALLFKANFHQLRNQPEQSRHAAQQAKEIFQASGDTDGVLKSMAVVASAEQLLGNAAAVRKVHDEAKSLRAGLEESRAYVVFASELANVLAGQGDINSAVEELEEVERWAEERGNVRDQARTITTRAQLLQSKGALVASNEAIDKALGLLAEEKGHSVALLHFLHSLNRAIAGEYKAARVSVDRAIASEPRVDEIGMADMARSLIYYGEGNMKQAEAAARRAIAGLEKYAPAYVFYAAHVLIPILVEEGNLEEARVQYERSRAAVKEARGTTSMSLAFETIDAVMLGQSQRREDVFKAEKWLGDIAAKAGKLDLPIQALEAETQRARLEMAHGQVGVGRARLGRVTREAEDKGILLYAAVARRVMARGKN